MRNYIRFLLFFIVLAAIIAYSCQLSTAQPAKERILERAISEQEVWEEISKPEVVSEAAGTEEESLLKSETTPKPKEPKKGWVKTINDSISPFRISGEYRVNFGWERDDPIITESNFDYWERNWRMLYGPMKENTYDPAVFDRFRLNIDREAKNSWGMRANLTVDPWSYTGKSSKVTVLGNAGLGRTDPVELELKWWGNTRRTINETYYTQSLGDAIYIPETKTIDGKTTPITATSLFGTTFNIPEIEIKKTFMPLRELWVDYDSDILKFKVFPMAYENQAFTSDDPLGLSNHHIYWESSPWLWQWTPGIHNSGAAPNDFTQGRWSFDLANYTKDGDGTRLTALRGGFLEITPTKDLVISAQAASPKTLWQDYDSFDSFPGAVSARNKFFNCFTLGGIYTFRYGYKNRKEDAYTHVFGADFDYEFLPKFHVKGEAATSRSKQDMTSDFKTKKRGNVFQISVSRDKEVDREGKMAKGDYCGQLTFTHMDEAFDPGLASYRFTRNDMFWGRHIFFDHPRREKQLNQIRYPTSPGYPSLTIHDFMPFRIGDGIDTGRDVIRFNTELRPNDDLELLFDVRNVHNTSGGYVETAWRGEGTYKINSKLTSKIMLLYVDLPKTRAGVDPFLYDPYTDRYWINNFVQDGDDPSQGTVSAGLSYDVTNWLTLEGVYEFTNDASLATGDYPRGLFNGLTFMTTPFEDFTLRYPQTFLFQQNAFQHILDYKYFNVVRLKSYIMPLKGMDIKLECTFNDNKLAGGIDDNINHAGVEIDYQLNDRMGIGGAYVYSKAIDLGRLVGTNEKTFEDHHNIYGEFRYRVRKNGHFLGQYGVYTKVSPNVFATMSPYGGFSPVLDTQHIVRLMYTESF